MNNEIKIIMMVNSTNPNEKALWSVENGLIQVEGVNSFFLQGYVKHAEEVGFKCKIKTVVVTPNSSKFNSCSFTNFKTITKENNLKIKDYLYTGKLDDGHLDYNSLFND